MDYLLLGADGTPLEARLSIGDRRVTLHSRSGRARRAPAGDRGRNPDYVAAFDAIFERLNIPTSAIEQVLLDSAPAREFAEELRLLATSRDFEVEALSTVKDRMRARMRAFGRTEGMPANEGNQNKRVRIDTSLADEEIRRRLKVVPADRSSARPPETSVSTGKVERLPAAELRRVKSEHVRAALARLDAGDPASHFDPARDYDAKTGDGHPYAPKKVFGLALEEALGIVAWPGHFSAGWGTPCFDILEEAGMWIVPREGSAGRPRPDAAASAEVDQAIVPTEEERTWIEGNPRIVMHLKRERQPGLAAKKREQFIVTRGQLLCEHCGLDPVKAYGPEAGAACIEVHHHRTHVADMAPGHETSLDDLKCLCSNCHRVLHRALSLGLSFEI